MKVTNKIKVLVLIILFTCCINQTNKISDQDLIHSFDNLIETKNYFKLKESYTSNVNQLSQVHKLYYSAIINNVFNKHELSNIAIKNLLTNSKQLLTDTALNKLYRTKLLNHINLFEYEAAAKASEYIQTNYLHLNDSNEIEMLQNEIKIWQSLKDVDKQQIIRTKDEIIPLVKDKVGLFNIDVSFGNTTKNLLFDTGANFSVINKSLAKELGFNIIEADFHATTSTGLQVKSDIAIANELTIGSIKFKNVVFLVLDNSDLSFPQIDYYINGVIGFPVIESLEEIRINKENQIFVPHDPVEYTFNNLALDGLMPIITVQYNDDTLLFHFDTGATKTSLYQQFYKDYKHEIDTKYTIETLISGGSGGMVEFQGYKIDSICLKVANSNAKLKDLSLHIEQIGKSEVQFHGNLGQDYIEQFDEMIISFKYSSVLFKNNAAK